MAVTSTSSVCNEKLTAVRKEKYQPDTTAEALISRDMESSTEQSSDVMLTAGAWPWQ